MSGTARRIVLVTGASRGLGREIAVAFAREGAYVAIGYRAREDKAREALEAVRVQGGDGEIARIELREPATVNAIVDKLCKEQGGLDALVNNAGVARDALFAMMSAEDWAETVTVNLQGAFHCCRAALRPMMARRKGSIVNVASIAGLHASPGQANYAASKGGLLAMTRTLAVEVAPYGIRVNAVVPGLLNAGMAARLDRRVADERRQRIPLGRFGEAAEVAKVAVFLAGDAASYIVGQAIVVDGGMTA